MPSFQSHEFFNPTVGSVRWLRGLEATYTEHGSITSDNRENRSKSRTRSHLATYTERNSVTSDDGENRSSTSLDLILSGLESRCAVIRTALKKAHRLVAHALQAIADTQRQNSSVPGSVACRW